MPLRLYNTLTRQKVPFEPLDPSSVRLYACGPTVYDHLHIGNGRMLIVFDVLFRLLRHEYGADHVTYVRNITDVDDKINARAAERGVDIRVLTDEMTKVFHEDAKALGCLAPTVEPRATDHITEMIALIEKLIGKGHAYVAEGHNSGDLHVLFDVPSMPDYGKLSKRPLDEMIAGARVEVAPYKRGPMDFVLWKPSSAAEPGWESPWGRGRPGWHIECSAMSWKHLGETFDIHGGGIDLVFPHHENEMAQSCSAFGHDVMANYWMHNGHLQVEGEKMSKSVGNFVTIRDLLTTDKFGGWAWPGDVIRLAMLKTHYRDPINWRADGLEQARKELWAWTSLIATRGVSDDEIAASEDDAEIQSALMDDVNTPRAIAQMHGLFQETKRTAGAILPLAKALKSLGFRNLRHPRFFSFTFAAPNLILTSDYSPGSDIVKFLTLLGNGFAAEAEALKRTIESNGLKLGVDDEGKISITNPMWDKFVDQTEQMVAARNTARKNKNWPEADRIRDELDVRGVVLKDNKDGTTTWEVPWESKQ
jgi:cysteinyl-tRNA synthetase